LSRSERSDERGFTPRAGWAQPSLAGHPILIGLRR
jgi:hypothetical protein